MTIPAIGGTARRSAIVAALLVIIPACGPASDDRAAPSVPGIKSSRALGATRGPTYFCYLAQPGEHEITIEADEVERITFRAEAGRNYLLEQQVVLTFGWVRCKARWRDAAEAEKLFAAAEHEVLVGVPGDEKLPPLAIVAPARSGSEAVRY